MTSRLSKLILTSHITFSISWLGAVVVFIVLAITGLTSLDNQVTRSALFAMEISAWFVILPFCIMALFTGVIQSLVTKWGLIKHYWIVVKLFLTVAMTILLLLHMQPINYLANLATKSSFSNLQSTELLLNIIIKAGAAILVLIFITTISVYKPWGKIQFKNTSNNQLEIKVNRNKKKSSSFYLFIILGIFFLFIVLKHLFSGMSLH